MEMSTEESLESCESGHAQCRCLLDVPDAPFVDCQERRQSVDGRFRGYLADMRNHYFVLGLNKVAVFSGYEHCRIV